MVLHDREVYDLVTFLGENFGHMRAETPGVVRIMNFWIGIAEGQLTVVVGIVADDTILGIIMPDLSIKACLRIIIGSRCRSPFNTLG